jgi:DMSO/TMAO reductase YedYZ molybdopterin-dependent catalytic subunit
LIRACYETSSIGLEFKGIARVVDCPLTSLEVRTIPEVRELVTSTLRGVFGDIPGDVIFDSNEAIGYTHTLHRFRVQLSPESYIGVRVVVAGKRAIRVIFTIPRGLDVKPKHRISIYNPELDLTWEAVVSTSSQSAPRGQFYIDIPVVYAILGVPRVDLSKWLLSVDGLVERRLGLSLSDLYELGVERTTLDFHCVTGWSVRELEFAGVPVRRLVELARPKNSVKWVYVESLDGYSTIIPYSDFAREDSLVALEMSGKPLDTLHGYPARLLFPHLYGWKSAKWISRVVFTDKYTDGYWEALGYHPRGRVEYEERFKIT